MKNAFVTGGTGFIGLNLIDELLATKRYQVWEMHCKSSDVRELKRRGVHLAVAGLDDPEAIRLAMPEFTDVVFHAAANTSTWSKDNDQQTKDNVEGTRNMVEAALKRKVPRFVFTSSIAAYGFH